MACLRTQHNGRGLKLGLFAARQTAANRTGEETCKSFEKTSGKLHSTDVSHLFLLLKQIK